MKNKFSKLGFTLIELLAAIIIIIVVIAIAVPLVINMIDIVKREAFRATAYSIADSGRLLIANQNESQGYQEFFYLDGKEYNADNKKLDYSGEGPKTGVVILNEKNRVVMAIHNGTYCAIKSADTNKVTVTKTLPDDCNAYSIITTCDIWEQIAIKYDVSLADLLAANNETDSKSSTCDRDIKIPVSSTSSGSSYAGDGGTTVYYKTYYTMGYVSSSSTLPLSYQYTIKLGVLPLNIADIEVTRVTTQSVFESLDDFKRYITKKNMGEVIWPGETPAEIDISQASVFRDHAADSMNMSADDVFVSCDTEACYATVNATVNNLNNVNPNTIEGVGQVAYTPIKFTVEFNGEGETCTVRTATDTVPGILAGAGTNVDPYLVESVEDLVALSNNVSAGNTYSGKYISFTNSFDFNNSKSYENYGTTEYGDINGNGNIEGLLTELTTGAGFNPIGNGTTKFSGRILGNTNCINNLYINRSANAYVGFVGYNDGGSITALTLNDINITGSDYTGGLTGYTANNNITASGVNGDVTGNNYVGLVSGYAYTYTTVIRLSNIIAEGNVVGANYVGGFVGFANNYCTSPSKISGIYKGGNITSTGGNVGRIIGGKSNGCGDDFANSSLALSSIQINGAPISSTYPTSNHGAEFDDLSALNNINLIELSLDTYYGGDNDGDGYYYDYNDNGIIVQKKISNDPLTFSLSGSGTTADPYLINTAADLKQINLKLGSAYKLMNDIDLTGNRFYMIGSSQNNFSGTFDGNGKTISNLTLNNPNGSYAGLFGYSRGTIKNLTLSNFIIDADNYIGALAGYNSGTISSVALNNINITARDNAGGLVGYNTGTILESSLSNIDISGLSYTGGIAGYINSGNVRSVTVEGDIVGTNYTGLATGYLYTYTAVIRLNSVIADGNIVGANYVGGLVGFANNYCAGSSSISGIYRSGSIVATGGNVGRTIGGKSNGCGNDFANSSLALSSIPINGNPVTSTYPSSNHGADFGDLSDLNNINFIEQALDTYIGGDNDGDGYYYDYNDSGTLVEKKVSEYPFVFNLSGAGTTADPYLINTAGDLKQINLKLGSVYKLNANLDLTGNNFYVIGSYQNVFSGTFDGNNKTISNLTISNPNGSYTGLFGNNKGTIKNLALNNFTSNSSNYAGGLAGYNSGTVTAVTLNNIDITARDYTGGIVGYNKGTILGSDITGVDINALSYTGGIVGYISSGNVKSSTVSGNVVGSNYTGLAAGYIYTYTSVIGLTGIIADGNVTGANYVAGIVGFANDYCASAAPISGIYRSGSIIATGSNVGRTLAGKSNGCGNNFYNSSLALKSITINGSPVTSTYPSSNHGADFDNLSDLNDINFVELSIDTYTGGDNDGDGYYFDYDDTATIVKKIVVDYPLTFSLPGSGTAADPYLINSVSDLKQINLKLSSVYKLNTDLDLTGHYLYMIGSYHNGFSGTFDGNNKTVNNLTLNNLDGSYTGLFGNNRGTIKNLALTGFNINSNNYVGSLAGTNSGTIREVTVNNANITSLDNTGGLAGYSSGAIVGSTIAGTTVNGYNNTGGIVGYVSSGNVIDNVVTANVRGNNYVGLASGYVYTYTAANKITSILAEGNVDGSNYVGGLVGFGNSYCASGALISGVYRDGIVSSIGTSIARGVAGRSNGCGNNYILNISALSSIPLNGTAVTSTSATGANGLDITSSDLLNTVTYTDRGFNFTDEALDYIWYIDGSRAKFRVGSL